MTPCFLASVLRGQVQGFLTGAFGSPDDFAKDDYRRFSPRFQGENFQRNLELVDQVKSMAADKGVKPAQLALAWVLAQGEDLIPIPGTKHRTYLEENIAAVDIELSQADLARLNALFPPDAAAGMRYPEAVMTMVNI